MGKISGPNLFILLLLAAAGWLFATGQTVPGAIALGVVVLIYLAGFTAGRMGSRQATLHIKAAIEHVDKVKAAREAFYGERSFYLKVQSNLGDADPKTKAAAANTTKALNAVGELDELFVKSKERIDLQAQVIMRCGSKEERQLVEELNRKMLALAADDGRLR